VKFVMPAAHLDPIENSGGYTFIATWTEENSSIALLSHIAFLLVLGFSDNCVLQSLSAFGLSEV